MLRTESALMEFLRRACLSAGECLPPPSPCPRAATAHTLPERLRTSHTGLRLSVSWAACNVPAAGADGRVGFYLLTAQHTDWSLKLRIPSLLHIMTALQHSLTCVFLPTNTHTHTRKHTRLLILKLDWYLSIQLEPHKQTTRHFFLKR